MEDYKTADMQRQKGSVVLKVGGNQEVGTGMLARMRTDSCCRIPFLVFIRD